MANTLVSSGPKADKKRPELDSGDVLPGSGGRFCTYDLWVMRHHTCISGVPSSRRHGAGVGGRCGAQFGQDAIFVLAPADRRVLGCTDKRVVATGWTSEWAHPTG